MDLTASSLFAGLDQAAWNDILGRMRPRCYATGEHICREGDASDRMFLIESGVVEVMIGEGPTARVITHLRRGEIVGEMGLLSDEPRSASILAAMPTLTLELDRAAFTQIINRYPGILLNISRVLVERQKRSLRSLARSGRGDVVLLMIGRGTESVAGSRIYLGTGCAAPRSLLAGPPMPTPSRRCSIGSRQTMSTRGSSGACERSPTRSCRRSATSTTRPRSPSWR